MTIPCFYPARARLAAVLLGASIAAQSASADEPSNIDYAYSMPRIWKSSMKDFDFATTTLPIMSQPKVNWTGSNFSRFLGFGDGETPSTDKAPSGLPWEQLRKSAPNQRWRPLAPVEESEPTPVTDVTMRFWDEGAGRLYR